MTNILIAGDLLEKLEKLHLKNRDLLSVEDEQVLNDCISALKELQEQESDEKSEEVFGTALKVILHLLKFFTDVEF
ncbi:MAG: hypothetical protein R8N23_04995 [Reichenbachiella sp.]|uniref:hypothetical protein n=1 Tax=Reichenbachiella sp. TaxID=2184521 RepID=UPI002965F44A|nr:hypothetical protein [Reichenbachiella sp.]MDW3209200.1 hypothetical protein [Reichenbachiella sp.]